MKKQDTACVILARGGSVGLPGKNLRRIGGVSLLGRSIRAARSARTVDQVFVSTEDREIAEEARRFGAIVIDRPEHLADAHSSSEEGWLHALPFVQEVLPTLRRLVFLQCTSPFTTSADVEGCLAEMERTQADCALSVTKDHGFLWRKTANGWGQGVNHSEMRQRLRRQDLPEQFRETGAIYCVRLQPFLRQKNRFCGSVALFEVAAPAVEIDDARDLALCRKLSENAGHYAPAADQLRKVGAIAMDFDGVHTDNRVFIDENARESVCCSRSDGMGIELLKKTGRFSLLILSKERNPVVAKRAEKLGVEVHCAADDKVAILEPWLAHKRCEWSNLLFVGNDVNDIAAMQRAGLCACPSDAHPEVLTISDWILPAAGGRGALRAMADCLLAETCA